MGHVLVARLDNLGDVLLSGPLVRAVGAKATTVRYLCSRRGEAAARLLPGVDEVMVTDAGWIEDPAPPVTTDRVLGLVDRVRAAGVDEAVILTSFHQSPLPLAMVLRMAGVARIGAVCTDYAGSLLDVRHRIDEDVHEVTRSLALGCAMGFALPAGDRGQLRVPVPGPVAPPSLAGGPYVVVHPGASVPARAADPNLLASVVHELSAAGHRVAVTGTAEESALTARVAGARGVDLGGAGDLGTLARLIAGASVTVVGNTGPAHLSAAVGTPVVSLFAPTVPAVRWRPWMVPHVLLGDQNIVCAGCRARHCPVPGHPCLSSIAVQEVVAAVDDLCQPERGATGARTEVA